MDKQYVRTFDIRVADKCGMFEAIVFQYFSFWCRRNKRDNRNFVNGRYWTYNSILKLEEVFTYATGKQINTAITNLVKSGLIIKEHLGKNKQNRVCWYALSDEALEQYPLSIKELEDIGIFENKESHIIETKKEHKQTLLSDTKNTDIDTIEDEETALSVEKEELIINNTDELKTTKKVRVKCKRPDLAEVKAYCEERNNNISAEKFLDYQDARGWCLGKGVPIVDWKAAIRTWENNNYNFNNKSDTVKQDSNNSKRWDTRVTVDDVAAGRVKFGI